MKSQNNILRNAGAVTVGLALATAAMIGIFALVGKYDASVLLGGLAGAAVSAANYVLMVLFANRAADKAEAQDVVGGQKLIQLSYMGRMLGMFLILILCAKSGLCNVLALVLPLAFTRPILTIMELFKKKGDAAV